jgi:hypothetical protein
VYNRPVCQVDAHVHAREEALCSYREGVLVVAVCAVCGDVKLREPQPADSDLALVGGVRVDAHQLVAVGA